jgi:hypothetical protein
MALTITIPGAVETTTGSTAPAVLTVGVGSPGVGVPSGGSTGQYLVKASATSYDTAWLTLPANYITSVTAPLAVTAGNLAVDLSAYLTTATAASTYQTIAGMSSYLTSATAASTYAVIAAGQPTSGTVGQVLTKNSGTNYDSSWATLVPGDRYLTSSTTSNTIGNGTKSFTIGTGLSYTPTQSITVAFDASNHMHGEVLTYNSGTGALSVDINHHTGSGTYTAWTVNVAGVVPVASIVWGDITGTLGNQTDLATALNAKLASADAATTYAPIASPTFTGTVTIPPGASISGFAPLASPALTGNVTITTNSAGAALFIEQTGAGNILTLHDQATDTNFVAIDANGKVNTVVADATTAGLNVPHGVAPTSPVNGDIWTTTTALFARVNASTKQMMTLSDTQTVSGSITFSNASQTLGNSTATGTINVASGATISASTKTLNIGTGGVSGSTTTTILGPVLGASTTTIGGTTAASTLNLATGATLTATTKAVNIGTSGVAGSTTNIAIGSTTGTSTTTLQGNIAATGTTIDLGNSAATGSYTLAGGSTTTGQTKSINIGTSGGTGSTTNITLGSSTSTNNTQIYGASLVGGGTTTTAAVDTNSTVIASTAYVVGQAGSATPIVDGTAAVGTSLRYARQDHVHPTDTSRAALASPTFTGTPTLPTGTIGVTQTAGNSTTALATTAFVTTADNLKANLASPTFTGTPTLPTGTIATTQSPGNNTTAVATTAFVTAAVPAFATLTDVIGTPSSTTLALNPSLAPWLMANANVRYFGRLGFTSVVGGAADNYGTLREVYTTAASQRATFLDGAYGYASYGLRSSTDAANINFSKKLWLFGIYFPSSAATSPSYYGDANTVSRINIGGRSAAATGDITQKGIGLYKAGGTGSTIYLTVHNGTTLTSVSSGVTNATGQSFKYVIYSDGTGNVTLYLDGVSVATTSAGPTGMTVSGYSIYEEQVETSATFAVRQAMNINGAGIIIER